MGWAIALAVLTAIGLIPLGVSLRYEEETFLLRIRVFCFQFSLPKKGKKKEKVQKAGEDPVPNETEPQKEKGPLGKALEERKQAKLEAREAEEKAAELEKKLEQAKLQKEQQEQKVPAKKEKKPDIRIYLPFVRLALDFLGSLRRKLRIEKLYAKVILAGDDPCDLATLYGKAWAAATALMGHLNQAFVIKDQDIDIQCDFAGEKIQVRARLDLTITIGRLLGLAVSYGIRALKEYFIFKKRKGGAAL